MIPLFLCGIFPFCHRLELVNCSKGSGCTADMLPLSVSFGGGTLKCQNLSLKKTECHKTVAEPILKILSGI